jgi:hypothetical protein
MGLGEFDVLFLEFPLQGCKDVPLLHIALRPQGWKQIREVPPHHVSVIKTENQEGLPVQEDHLSSHIRGDNSTARPGVIHYNGAVHDLSLNFASVRILPQESHLACLTVREA